MTRNLFRPTRRKFLIGLGTAAAVGLYTWRVEPHWVQVVERKLPIARLPDSLVGKKLVQISDLHVGYQVDNDYLIGTFKQIEAMEPDLVVITGDFMTSRAGEQIDNVATVMQHLRPGTLGCAAILGNHDSGNTWRRTDVADNLTRRLTDLGIDVLRNRSQAYDGLTIWGLDDLWSPTFRGQQVLAQVDPTQANLVLSHNPDAVDKPIWSGYQGWILSGHTHGGQCKPPFLPPPLLPVINRRYTSGEFDLWDGRWLYINRGLGHLRRVRFNARPEITCFTLVNAPSAAVTT